MPVAKPQEWGRMLKHFLVGQSINYTRCLKHTILQANSQSTVTQNILPFHKEAAQICIYLFFLPQHCCSKQYCSYPARPLLWP